MKGVNRTLGKLTIAIVFQVIALVSPAAAAHGTQKCSTPSDLVPLFELLHSLTQLAFLAGVGLGTLGFMAAGLMIAAPVGEDWSRRGKKVAKSTLFGVIILLSSQMIVAFLVDRLGGVFC